MRSSSKNDKKQDLEVINQGDLFIIQKDENRKKREQKLKDKEKNQKSSKMKRCKNFDDYDDDEDYKNLRIK